MRCGRAWREMSRGGVNIFGVSGVSGEDVLISIHSFMKGVFPKAPLNSIAFCSLILVEHENVDRRIMKCAL